MCKEYVPSVDGREVQETRRRVSDLIEGTYASLKSRGITQETCEFWSYQVGDDCHIANYKDPKGQRIAQKIRREGKKFSWTGDAKHPYFYGQWLWGSGKSVVITEGEIDALSMSQAFRNKWPVVSLKDGADSAVKCIHANYEWLDQFERIVLMFDQDKPGHKATEEAAAVLPMGKAYIARLPRKDANEVLLEDGPEVLVKAFWNATPWRPDGIVSGAEITVERLTKEVSRGFEIPFPKLQEKMLGLRKGELTLLTAGSGVGKSTLAKQLAYNLQRVHGCKIGNVYLEESNDETAIGYIALHSRVPFGELQFDKKRITREQWDEGYNSVTSQMLFYDHWGSLESTNLVGKLRYLATVGKCDFIVLDHITIVSSGQESSDAGERKDLDVLMTRLKSLTQETGVGIIAIVHLKRAQGKNFNEGSQISLNDLRGSASLEQLSNNVIGVEGDQQSEAEGDMRTIRLLKCRAVGRLGVCDTLTYNRETGWLEIAAPKEL